MLIAVNTLANSSTLDRMSLEVGLKVTRRHW